MASGKDYFAWSYLFWRNSQDLECSPIHEAITHDVTFRRNDGDDFDVLIISACREGKNFELKIRQQLSYGSELCEAEATEDFCCTQG